MSEACLTIRIVSTHPSQGEFVEINASDFDAAKGHVRYDAPPPPPPKTPPPPPPLPGPLANLPKNWRDGKTAALVATAAAVSGGRTAENREQAVQMIEQALAARAK